MGGRDEADGEAEAEAEVVVAGREAEMADESEMEEADESETDDSAETADERDKLVAEAIGAVVEWPIPGISREIETSMIPLSVSVDEAEAEIKPETGFGSLRSMEVVGTAKAIDVPDHQY